MGCQHWHKVFQGFACCSRCCLGALATKSKPLESRALSSSIRGCTEQSSLIVMFTPPAAHLCCDTPAVTPAGLDCYTSQPVTPTGACTVMPPQNATQAVCDPGRVFSPSSSTQALALLAWRDSLQAGSSNPLFAGWGTGDPCALLWPGIVCASGAVAKIQLQPPSTGGNNITYTNATGSANWTALASLTGLTHLELQVRAAAL